MSRKKLLREGGCQNMKKSDMFSDDPRFQTAKKEAKIGIGLVIFNFIWWFGFAYGLGSGSPEKYAYIFGFPAWFFFSCIGGLIIMSILVAYVVKRFFQDVPFEYEGESTSEERLND